MIRISSQQVFSGGIDRIQDLNSGLNKTSERLSTGKRVNRPSDDPVAAARILKLNQELGRVDTYQRNAQLADNRLKQEESALGSSIDVIQRVRELTVQAGSGSLSANDRQSIASEMRERLGQLANIANTQDASGEYIFSGFQGNQQAFAQNVSGDWVYQGDEGQRMLEIDDGVTVPISDHGRDVFEDIPSTEPTFIAEASPDNAPGARISSGAVVDQEEFNAAYANSKTDYVVSIDENDEYTITERNGDGTALESGTFTSGEPITFRGMQFEVFGDAPDAADSPLEFTLKTTEKQSVFASIEKLIYGLENEVKGPASATVEDFAPNAGDVLYLNGEALGPFDAGNGDQELVDAVNANTALKEQGITAELQGGEVVISSEGRDLALSAEDGGDPPTQTFGGPLVVTGAKSDDLDVVGGVLSANFKGGQQAYEELIAGSLNNLDNAQDKIVLKQTELGGRMNAVESTQAFLEDSSVYSKDIRSQLQDVDYAEAISNLSFQSFVLQAAQQSFAKVSQLSLFDRL
ncbi:flagellar hook-associated protein FlgL [Marinobacter sp.]|uniref:flagellar hook-associated protein FlgL n=1 Tax=Marinobacter sp. TaxID=50741 RepID=UPI0034A1F156